MSDQTTGPAPSRREEFEQEIAAVRIRTGKAEAEQRFAVLGLVGLVAGPVLAILCYLASKGMSDSRDIFSTMILALFGLTLTIAGGALFLRYSMARFLRFWLLRLIYEQQDLK